MSTSAPSSPSQLDLEAEEVSSTAELKSEEEQEEEESSSSTSEEGRTTANEEKEEQEEEEEAQEDEEQEEPPVKKVRIEHAPEDEVLSDCKQFWRGDEAIFEQGKLNSKFTFVPRQPITALEFLKLPENASIAYTKQVYQQPQGTRSVVYGRTGKQVSSDSRQVKPFKAFNGIESWTLQDLKNSKRLAAHRFYVEPEKKARFARTTSSGFVAAELSKAAAVKSKSSSSTKVKKIKTPKAEAAAAATSTGKKRKTLSKRNSSKKTS
jgi:hypothetical protein